jgi:outer membrane protein OmpA-like peptidoglycan-associated protein
MPRKWMVAVPGCAFVIALAGCGDICTEMEPTAAPPAANVRQEQPVPTTPPPSTPAAPAAPAAAAAAVSCLAEGFPPNSARLNNVDKACLDDVVQRLKSDPRAHVVVIGHADSNERNADKIASGRARAARDYLVMDGGIDGGRVKVRSAAASRPLDAGTDDAAQAKNRRCEVWFVPEGASEPN